MCHCCPTKGEFWGPTCSGKAVMTCYVRIGHKVSHGPTKLNNKKNTSFYRTQKTILSFVKTINCFRVSCIQTDVYLRCVFKQLLNCIVELAEIANRKGEGINFFPPHYEVINNQLNVNFKLRRKVEENFIFW